MNPTTNGELSVVWWVIGILTGLFVGIVSWLNKRLTCSLYRGDGTTIYIPRSDCHKSTAEDRESVRSEFAKVHSKLDAMEQKREESRKEQHAAVADLKETAAVLRGYLKAKGIDIFE